MNIYQRTTRAARITFFALIVLVSVSIVTAMTSSYAVTQVTLIADSPYVNVQESTRSSGEVIAAAAMDIRVNNEFNSNASDLPVYAFFAKHSLEYYINTDVANMTTKEIFSKLMANITDGTMLGHMTVSEYGHGTWLTQRDLSYNGFTLIIISPDIESYSDVSIDVTVTWIMTPTGQATVVAVLAAVFGLMMMNLMILIGISIAVLIMRKLEDSNVSSRRVKASSSGSATPSASDSHELSVPWADFPRQAKSNEYTQIGIGLAFLIFGSAFMGPVGAFVGFILIVVGVANYYKRHKLRQKLYQLLELQGGPVTITQAKKILKESASDIREAAIDLMLVDKIPVRLSDDGDLITLTGEFAQIQTSSPRSPVVAVPGQSQSSMYAPTEATEAATTEMTTAELKKKLNDEPIEQGNYIYCVFCGERVPAGSKFCNSCGASLSETAEK